MKKQFILFLLLLLLLPLFTTAQATSSLQKSPMGIATYENIETTQWLGIVHIISFPEPKASLQLNVVLNYEYAGKSYAIWVQDVAYLDEGGLAFVDNIWNLTGLNIQNVKGNGSVYSYNGMTFYAYSTPFIPISFPLTVYLLVNVTTNSLGEPVIHFWYNYGNGWVNYDTVTILARGSTNVYFLSTQSQRTQIGGYYDGALVVVGPGNGESVNITKNTIVYLQLFYWNGHNFQEVKNAYNVGLDTGETAINAHVVPVYNKSNGELEALYTEGNENFSNLWNPNNISILTIHAPINEGYIYVYNANLPYQQGEKEAYKIPFIGGEAVLTLYPMDYAILLFNKDNQLVGEANIYAKPGYISTNITNFTVYLEKENNYVNIIIHAYGNVTINVISPIKESFTTYVNGVKTIKLNVAGNVIVNASLFPGFYIIRQLYIPAQVIFNLNVPLANVTLFFPNSTIKTITIHNGENISVPLNTKYVLQNITETNIRWVTQTLVSGFINQSEETVSATYYEQRLVVFKYEVINGQWNLTPPNVTYYYFTKAITTSLPIQTWVNYNSTFSFLSNITVNNERLVLIKVTNNSNVVIAYYVLQYYVNVNSPISLYALVNKHNINLTSGWYNATSQILIKNIPYYQSSVERYIITSIYPSDNITIDSPLSVNISAEKQFLVTIDSQQEWVTQGEKIVLNANIPFYETAVFTGTYNVPPGSAIIVNSPINEKLVTHLNYTFILLFIVVLLIIISVIIVKRTLSSKKRHKKRRKRSRRRR